MIRHNAMKFLEVHLAGFVLTQFSQGLQAVSYSHSLLTFRLIGLTSIDDRELGSGTNHPYPCRLEELFKQ